MCSGCRFLGGDSRLRRFSAAARLRGAATEETISKKFGRAFADLAPSPRAWVADPANRASIAENFGKEHFGDNREATDFHFASDLLSRTGNVGHDERIIGALVSRIDRSAHAHPERLRSTYTALVVELREARDAEVWTDVHATALERLRVELAYRLGVTWDNAYDDYGDNWQQKYRLLATMTCARLYGGILQGGPNAAQSLAHLEIVDRLTEALSREGEVPFFSLRVRGEAARALGVLTQSLPRDGARCARVQRALSRLVENPSPPALEERYDVFHRHYGEEVVSWNTFISWVRDPLWWSWEDLIGNPWRDQGLEERVANDVRDAAKAALDGLCA